jgi:hypothetical protein
MSEDLASIHDRVRVLTEERESRGAASPELLVKLTTEAVNVFHAAALK